MIKDADLEPLHQESLNSIWNRSPYHDQFTDLKNELKDEINSSQGFPDPFKYLLKPDRRVSEWSNNPGSKLFTVSKTQYC